MKLFIMLTAKDQKDNISLPSKIVTNADISKPFESDPLLFDITNFLENKTV